MSLLPIAIFLTFAVGVAHSILGERYIIRRLFRRPDLPRLLGGTEFTTRTIRFAWHVTTIAWWGLGGALYLIASDTLTRQRLGLVIGATFLVTSLIALVASRGRHLSWPVFLFIAAIAIYATR